MAYAKVEKNEWELLDDLGKCITEIVNKSHKAEFAPSVATAANLCAPISHTALRAKDLVNALKSAMIKSSAQKNSLPDSIQQALNSGDGVYRP